LAISVYVVWPAQAFALALLRIVHAVPGAGAATLQITVGSKTFAFGPVAFGDSSKFVAVAPGKFTWKLVGGGKTLATGTGIARTGTFTGVLMFRSMKANSMGVMLHQYRDHAAVPGRTLIRVIHSAPEFGSPSLQFDHKTVVRSLSYMMATPYLTVPAGTHSLSATAQGHAEPALSVNGVALQSGAAYSEIVVGTRGQMVRVVTVVDRGAPLTRPAPASKSMAGEAKGPVWVMIRPGDSLWKIAARRCGPGASNPAIYAELVRIWDSNATRIGTNDPNLIFPGTRLHIPLKD
jgi:hypothetical protein